MKKALLATKQYRTYRSNFIIVFIVSVVIGPAVNGRIVADLPDFYDYIVSADSKPL